MSIRYRTRHAESSKRKCAKASWIGSCCRAASLFCVSSSAHVCLSCHTVCIRPRCHPMWQSASSQPAKTYHSWFTRVELLTWIPGSWLLNCWPHWTCPRNPSPEAVLHFNCVVVLYVVVEKLDVSLTIATTAWRLFLASLKWPNYCMMVAVKLKIAVCNNSPRATDKDMAELLLSYRH